MKAAVISGISLCIHAFLVKNVAHNGIKIGNHLRIALHVDLGYAAAEGIKRIVSTVFLKISQPQVIIEDHFIGIVLQGR